ncbi:MAG TPA: homoserine dehydrogenase [Acidobacteriota bacterium]|jgi:homoserine dehydrogenase
MTAKSAGAHGGKPVSKVAIIGFGTVGRSVAKILCEHSPRQLQLTHIYNRNIGQKRVPWVPNNVCWTDNIDAVLASDVDLVVELIGGLKPAEEWIRRAIVAGKSVVTANKQVIGHCGPELLHLARQHECQIRFEASVAGGIPVVSGLREGLAGDRLFRVSGILNGTCNYILTRMESAGLPFSVALEEAQSLGYAEADPSDDVDGFDARSKLAILASIGLRCRVRPLDIACKSIKVIEAVDFIYARRLGCAIRQISRAERKLPAGRTLFASVQPALVPSSSPLARVQGSQNLVMSTGEFGGETVFSGYGAGGDPTAVAVISDLISLAENRQSPVTDSSVAEEPYEVVGEFNSPHYVRFTVEDRPGIIAALATVLANYQINIDAVLQERGPDKSKLPFVMTLEECNTSVLEGALRDIEKLDFHVQPLVSLPMLS